MTDQYPEPTTRRFITASVMAATVMNSLDSTIANVALPHMQGSVAASLGELVGFRLLQGVFGAALVPMSQAILLDINPPERHGPAMSIWGMGAILGPIVGPALGGWLTDNYDWRWVFYINLPIGALAFAGLWFFLSESKAAERVKLDLFGFAMLALAIASFQVMLDRGQQLDWFSSLEICIEAAAAAFFFYLFIVHTLTAKAPFIQLALFADRNFVAASIFGFFLGVLIFAVLALLPPMLEELMGYPVVLTGLVTAPRGVGTMISMIAVGQLIKRVDSRILIGTGLALAAWSTLRMSGFSLGMGEDLIISSGLVQGLGTGLIFVPLSTVAFATLNPALRNEGAAMFTLVRNIGSAIGISVLQFMTIRNADVVHARLVEGARPDNPAFVAAQPDFDFSSLASLARLNGEISRQASMVSYTDAFYALFVVTLIVAPLILMMRPPRKGADAPAMHMD